ncbi:Reverse transcriptase domain [Arabidopsis suecica]|uniref:Reverse transcriptase domain n=1 Tax=Arabidopsis suecica TaxID=45249 RepID=A0A8T2CLK4_ARASU|nr:Reverse transcriptase domain [Arabidopsis suecica]
MSKAKNEPRASVEGGCGVADGDGSAAEIGGPRSVDKPFLFSSFHSVSTMVSGEDFFVLSFRRPASAPARNTLGVKRSLSHQRVVNGSENTPEAPAIVSCISTGGTGFRLRRNCIVSPSREVCWASDVESTSWASAADSFWWAYVVKSASWDLENPANIMTSKPNFMWAGADLTTRRLEEMCRMYSPGFLFLSETKNDRVHLQNMQVSLGFDSLQTVEPIGNSGGLALMYSKDYPVKFVFVSDRLIDIETIIDGNRVFITFVYGDPVVQYRELVWERLTRIGITRSDPWFMIGDFNEITGNHEKRGGKRRSESSFLPFRCMIENCGMIEVPSQGNLFSWVGRRSCGVTGRRVRRLIKSRLDRALGNEDWHTIFSHTNVEYLKLWGSDHRPLLASIQNSPPRAFKQFFFDKRWLGKPGFKESVVEGWNFPSLEGGLFTQRIKNCRRSISKWKKSNSTNSEKLIKELQDKIDSAQEDESISAEELLGLKWRLCDAYREEEIFWKMKSRETWYQAGDKNTKIFHAITKQRRARNKILGLLNNDGMWVDKEVGIEHLAVDYFKDLFTTSDPQEFHSVLQDVPNMISEDMNQKLTREISPEEVKKALFSLHPDKAPGPDGMTAFFYQKLWDLIGQDLIKLVQNFHSSGSFDNRLNETNICLIPKTDRPRKMTEFRPISLCNVGYKVISKVLSLRLKKLLPDLISETQSAFVAGRLITDNILIAQENFHALRTNPACKKKFMAIKTDMSKAYDRVEWSFLRALMLKMGFAQRWVDWIIFCISSVSYKVLINGSPRGIIRPSRGIRQGDPISPFLFILCTEALVAKLKDAEWHGRIQGLQISRASPSTSHLLFADDSLFFCKADPTQGREIIEILRTYGEASGQQLNSAKSSVMFGHDVDNTARNTIKASIGIHRDGGMGSYLGLPEQIHGSKVQVFSFVRDRLQKRLNTWSAKFLSKGGKEVLIKSVAQALPTYIMSCFLLPKAIRSKLSSAIANFWWKTNENSNGIHWIAWDKLCTPYSEGGLGFRTLEEFNLALLAKQLWRLIKFPNSLLSRVLRGRYYRFSDPLHIGNSNRPSYGWRSIMAAKPLLVSGLRRTIGSGMLTKVWEDPWIPTIPARAAKSLLDVRDPLLYVNDLIDQSTKLWKLDRLQALIDPADIPLILGIRPSRTYLSDGYSWSHTKSGNYSVKSGYWAARELSRPTCDPPFQGPGVSALQAQVWKLKTTRKLMHFAWQCVSGCLATYQRLCYRHIGNEKGCPRCGAPEESINHLLFDCPPSRQIWALSPIPTSGHIFPRSSLFYNFDFLFWRGKEFGIDEETLELFPWILWYIWKSRNRFCFENFKEPPQETLALALREASMWKKANMKEAADPESIARSVLLPASFPRISECQIDASWHSEDSLSGHGWVLVDQDRILQLGLMSSRRSLSPLHAEIDSLLWAMECLISLGITNGAFASDCSDMISILDNQDAWPSFAAEMSSFRSLVCFFPSFNIRFVPRSFNTRADCLAKKARARNSLFSHVSSSVPDWLSLAESLFPIS